MGAGDAQDAEAASASGQLQPEAGSSSGTAAAQPGWLREEAERRLLSLCRRLVVDAASDAWSHHGAAAESGFGTAPDGTSWDQVSSAVCWK